jgi:hypothetical protein
MCALDGARIDTLLVGHGGRPLLRHALPAGAAVLVSKASASHSPPAHRQAQIILPPMPRRLRKPPTDFPEDPNILIRNRHTHYAQYEEYFARRSSANCARRFPAILPRTPSKDAKKTASLRHSDNIRADHMP